MSPSRLRLAVAAAASVVLALVALPARAGSLPTAPVLHAVPAACANLASGRSHCYLQLLADANDQPHATSGPTGYGPADLQGAYGLAAAAAANGATQTVAIVDAYDDPKAESDLATYRQYYGLPACTTANGCFKKVNQNGVAGSYPTGDAGWGTEISLDVDMVSAVCPKCHILLVEATDNTNTNLYAAEDTAARLGATVISNSYGGGESSAETASDSHFNHPGIPITVSSGDSGYGVEYPAASRYVTAVGGTTLSRASNARGWNETVWSGAGSGCSAYEAKPTWQVDTACAKRTVADVSAVADPNTGVAVYDSYSTTGGIIGIGGTTGGTGWMTVGGTSASAPIIGATYALAGNGASVTYGSYPYSHTASLFDITSGTNASGGLLGSSCGGNYLCTAKSGYDGPTGVGTPNGTAGF
jgi:subtilase family serine protease